ncbi:MAG: CPBP family intramembrane metalloprotease [Planctomycetes bacterium]|nr:CPBP family intramembrane metalloprotease [Planctomycetota bacterium]
MCIILSNLISPPTVKAVVEDVSASPEWTQRIEAMNTRAAPLLGLSVLLGVGILLARRETVRLIFKNINRHEKTELPFGVWECVKCLGFLIVAITLAGAVRLALGIEASVDNLLLIHIVIMFFFALYMMTVFRVAGIGAGELGIGCEGLGVKIVWAVQLLFAFMPLFLLIGPLNAVLVNFVNDILQIKEEPSLMQGQLQFLVDPLKPQWIRIAFGAFAIIGAPLTEEMFFRGMLYGFLKRKMPWGFAAVTSGLLFGLIHGKWFALPIGMLGVYLACVREYTGSLLISMLIHGLFNGMMIGILLYASNG